MVDGKPSGAARIGERLLGSAPTFHSLIGLLTLPEHVQQVVQRDWEILRWVPGLVEEATSDAALDPTSDYNAEQTGFCRCAYWLEFIFSP